MSRLPRRLVCVLAASTLIVAACGGDDSSSEAADLRAQLAELQQELAENANTDLQSQLAELEAQLAELEAEVEQAPPAEEAPIEDATVYDPPADAAPAAPTADAAAPLAPAEIEYSIDQSRTNASRFSIMVEASAPDLRTNTLGIKAVCLYQYNEYGTSVHGDPKRPCSRSNGLLASYLPYAKSWSVLGQCGSNGRIKDYDDIGIVAEDGRSVVVRVKDSPC